MEPTQTLPLLESGPQPLTRREARWWATVLVAIGVLFAVLLPAAAYWVASQAVPPGAVRFGPASVIPADGWTLQETELAPVALTQGGVVVFFNTARTDESLDERLAAHTEWVQTQYPELTAASEPREFTTPTGDLGQLRAIAGVDRTAVVATVVDDGVAADMLAVGESRAIASLAEDIEAMVRSLRLRGNQPGLLP